MCVISSVAIAGFDIQDQDTDEEWSCFGNAQNATFRRAIECDSPLDAEDKAFLASVDTNRINNRWRLKALIGRPRIKLENVEVNSTSPTLTVDGPEFGQDNFQLILGWGYKWTRWAMDLELLGSEQFHHNINSPTILAALPFLSQYSLDARYFAAFLNLEYEIPRFLDIIPSTIHPYIQGGIGAAVKSANNDIVIGTAAAIHSSHNIVTFAWNAGFGLKFEITGRLLGDIAYRWIDFGGFNTGTLIGAGTDPFAFLNVSAKHLRSHGLYFGITYQL